MKTQFSIQPTYFDNRQMCGFNWMEHVTAIPSPLVVVTTYKSNGKTNATMQSWLTFSNDNEFYCIFAAVNKGGHMYQTIHERQALVINFPSADVYVKCYDTIKHNHTDDDEITAAGLTAEPASKVDAPLITECFLNLECEFAWEKELFPGSKQVVMCVRIISMAMDEAHLDESQIGRYGDTGYLYNIHFPTNPTAGIEGPEALGTIHQYISLQELQQKSE